jgi:hypothetical protein
MQDTDGHYIVSFKEWHQCLKINSENGNILWRLNGEGADIDFFPADTFGDQHQINRTSVGTYIVFDNTGLDSLSRILEFSLDFYDDPIAINEWDWVLPQENFSNILGTAIRMDNNNRYALSGNTGSIFEVNSAGETLWHLRQSTWSYRTHYMAQLYDNTIEEAVIGNVPTLVCVDEPAIMLMGEPVDGCWSGSGVSEGMFDPMEAGIGTHTLTFMWGWNTATIDIEVSDLVPPCATGIEDYSSDRSVHVYPNPSKGDLTIEFVLDASSVVGIEMMDLTGRKVFSQGGKTFSSGLNRIQFSEGSDMAEGLYLLNVDINGQSITQRVIITK